MTVPSSAIREAWTRTAGLHAGSARKRRTSGLFQPEVRIRLPHHILARHIRTVGEVLLVIEYGDELVRYRVELVLSLEQFCDHWYGSEAVLSGGVAALGVQNTGTDDGSEILKIHLTTSFLVDV